MTNLIEEKEKKARLIMSEKKGREEREMEAKKAKEWEKERDRVLQKMRDCGRPCPFERFDRVRLSADGKEAAKEDVAKNDTFYVSEIYAYESLPVALWYVDLCKTPFCRDGDFTARFQVCHLALVAKHNDGALYARPESFFGGVEELD